MRPWAEHALDEGASGTVVVLDAKKLRGAGLAALLSGWASANRLTITLAEGDLSEFTTGDPTEVKLVVISIGSASATESSIEALIGAVRTRWPAAPLAICSDLESADAARAALLLGAQAFLPTSMQPEIVPHALNFVLAGGAFFPPTALLGTLPARGGGPRSPRALRDGP